MSAAPAAAAAAATEKPAHPTPKAGSEVTHLDWVPTGVPKRANKVALITGITGQGQQRHTHARRRTDANRTPERRAVWPFFFARC
jgi:hypothetical protein